MRLGIVDYGPCNLGSIKQTFDALRIETCFSNQPDVLQTCTGFVLPGVGHHGVAMACLRNSGLKSLLEDEVLGEGKPVLGICLGMQLMAQGSDESGDEGLGWLPASVRSLRATPNKAPECEQTLSPQIGWFSMQTLNDSVLWPGSADLPKKAYFCHSFGVVDLHIEGALARRCGGQPVLAAWQRNQLLGVQFHPEKSFGSGRSLMQHFAQTCALRAGRIAS